MKLSRLFNHFFQMGISLCLLLIVVILIYAGYRIDANEINRSDYFQPSEILASGKDYLNDLDTNEVQCWSKTRMPLRVYVYPDDQLEGYTPEHLKILKESFAAWSAASKGNVSFVFIDAPARADIEVRWRKRFIFKESEDAETELFHGTEGLEMAALCISVQAIGAAEEIKWRCLHEIGHALGIYGHSRNPEDIMIAVKYLNMAKATTASSLSNADCNTIFKLYDNFAAVQAQWRIQGDGLYNPDNDKGALNNTAIRKLGRGDFAAAFKDLEKALSLDPNYRRGQNNLCLAYNNLALKCAETGDFINEAIMLKKEVELCEKFYGISSQNFLDAVRAYIACLRKSQRNEDAEKWEQYLKDKGFSKSLKLSF